MSDFRQPALRVADWNAKFETHRTRSLRSLLWIPVPNDLAGESYLWLIDHENGAQHLGGWLAILMVVSRSPRPYRGWLQLENGAPHDAKSLARATRLPESLFEELLPRLLQIGLLETVTSKARKSNTLPSRNPAPISRDTAQIPRTKRSEAKRRNGSEGIEAAANRTEPTDIAAAADTERFRNLLEMKKHLGVLDDAMLKRIIVASGQTPFELFEARVRKRVREMGTSIESYAFFELLAMDACAEFRRSRQGAA